MGFFDMIFGNKRPKEGIESNTQTSIAKLREDIKNELHAEIIRENNMLREDLARELNKIHEILENQAEEYKSYDKTTELRKSISELEHKFSDITIMGRLAIENKEHIDRIEHRCATRDDIEALRHEILNVTKVDHIPTDEEIYEEKLTPEPKRTLTDILESMPQSRRALVNILLEAESPISYKQIANTMGLAYNTIKVYVRDIREAGFPVEEYMVQNKKLLNIPNSVKASLLYGQR